MAEPISDLPIAPHTRLCSLRIGAGHPGSPCPLHTARRATSIDTNAVDMRSHEATTNRRTTGGRARSSSRCREGTTTPGARYPDTTYKTVTTLRASCIRHDGPAAVRRREPDVNHRRLAPANLRVSEYFTLLQPEALQAEAASRYHIGIKRFFDFVEDGTRIATT